MMSDKFYDEFYRQRRNLILISVVLFFALSSGLTLNKVNIWGNEITLKNPDGILTFLWVVWAYWVWRFWVYALEYKDGFIKSFENAVIRVLRGIYDSERGEMGFRYKGGWCSISECGIAYVDSFPGDESEDSIDYRGKKFYNFVIPILIRTILSHKSFTDQIFPFLIALLPTLFIVWTRYIF